MSFTDDQILDEAVSVDCVAVDARRAALDYDDEAFRSELEKTLYEHYTDITSEHTVDDAVQQLIDFHFGN